ncbi:MAG: YkvA family protein [Jiangellaceae bacterium]|nr:YkvA family protein [Jiangellaceae bacterium]
MSRVRRTAAFVALWHFIRGQNRPGAPSLTTRINAFPRMVGAVTSGRWNGMGKSRLALMGLAVLYLLSPVDLVPEGLLLAIGLVDDVVVATWLAGSALDGTERFIDWENTQPQVVQSHVITDG